MKTNKVIITVNYDDGTQHSIEADLYKDGADWCCLVGKNIQDGVAGFGDRPDKAVSDLQQNIGFYK